MRRAEAQAIIQALVSLRNDATDKQALRAVAIYPKWKVGAVFKEDDVGKRVRHNGKIYRIVSPHTAMEHYPPDSEGVLALYRPVDVAHSGTADDPIPFVYGMDVASGLYYAYENEVWLAKVNMAPCVWPPADGNEWEKKHI